MSSSTSPQSERDVRIAKMHALRDMGINPYAQKFDKTSMIGDHVSTYEKNLTDGAVSPFRDVNDIIISPEPTVSTAGRLTLYRTHGKLAFGKLMDETGEIQLMFHRDMCALVEQNVGPHHYHHAESDLTPTLSYEEREMSSAQRNNNQLTMYRRLDPKILAFAKELRQKQTPAEEMMRELLRDRKFLGLKFRRQHPLREFMILDFYCYEAKFAIELDGGIHDVPEQKKSDTLRNEECARQGITVLRIRNEDLCNKTEETLSKIKTMIDKLLPSVASPSPVGEGLGGGHMESGMRSNIPTDVSLPDGLTPYKFLEKYIDVGDFLGVRGELFYTHKGELTLFVSEFMLVSKAIRPLGDKFHGIGDDRENLYRQRYLDMIFNRETMDRMKLRSNFIKTLRQFYRSHDFYEIDCPVLTPAASGAAAKPFVTHHNDFDRDFYLRICNETELKKATVGGFEKVFTIATVFRNEGSDPSHLQEFTMLEHQNVYRNLHEDMKLTEQMFDYLFDTLGVSRQLVVRDKQGNPRDVNFTTPRPKIDYVEGVNNASGLDITSYSIDDADRLRADIRAKGITFEGMDAMGTMTLIDYLYKKVLRPTIAGPAFVYNYPSILAPLARITDDDPNKCEKRQVVVNGREIINAYGELVDPGKQQDNFDEQAKAEAGGDAEATSADDDFVKAMEYGMPSQSGFGMGVDRIIAIMSGQDNLRDVVMFPLMKPLGGDDIVKPNEKIEKKSDLTQMTVILLNESANLESRQEMNTIAHLTAAFGARYGKSGLFSHDTIQTKDQHDIFLNIKNAIMIKTIPDNTTLQVLRAEALNDGLHIADFTREMITTTDDKKIVAITQEKNDHDVEHLGLLIHGPKKVVETMTKGFGLYGKG